MGGMLTQEFLHSGDVDTVIFEAFEASPSAEDVLAAENALQWDFPGRAAEIPLSEFLDESFQESLATFLQDASIEALARFGARSNKANVSVIETRDTTDPALVTQMLMPLLEAIGSSVDVPRIRKRVRDDVNIQNAELPWRRLPFWLILRVAVQRHLCFTHGNENGRAYYKFLICTVLTQLLIDCTGKLIPELSMMLKAKLCRRLAKLEMDKTRVPPTSVVYKQLFDSAGPYFKETIEQTTRQLELAWANLKRATTRPIPKLPSRADEQALQLSLPNSGEYLYSLLASPIAQRTYSVSTTLDSSGEGLREQFGMFTDRYFNLARLEGKIEAKKESAPGAVVDYETQCSELAQSIAELFNAVGNNYDSNPEQMSIFILNLFDLWVKMDKSAIKACPLLGDYYPVFSPELLDVLQLPTLSGMQRLNGIQRHLRGRCIDCQFPHKTLFSEPDEDCFAARYLKSSGPLQRLQQQIENASNTSYALKKSEWKTACEQYDELSRKISDGTCVCSLNADGSRNVRGCTKCWHWRCRKKMEITVHEDFLPEDRFRKAAVVFELGIPSYLAAYRNVTWRILSDLGHPSKPVNSTPPAMLLKDYTQLQSFRKSTIHGISLASANKSFLQTHFKARKMKVELSDISSPLALKFSYFDMISGTWLKNLDKPLTFQHLSGIYVPRGLRLSIMPSVKHPGPNVDGPSSYQIVSSQTECPPDMSVHEFMSYQRLLAGNSRRWPTMLVELGASNLNFSTEDTMHVFSQLAIQAGPAKDDKDLLRDAHFYFRDQCFCQRLMEQIVNRLNNISSNWRETHCMEMLITLSLRLFDLCTGSDRQSAERLLRTAREVTSSWSARLRDEVRSATEADMAERAARYGLWAALLCRRTFTTFVELEIKMTAEDLCTFVQASVALQENLITDLAKLPQNLKNMLLRDAKMVYQIQSLVKQSIVLYPESLGSAINNTWSDSSNSTGRTYSPWQFLAHPHERWTTSRITSSANEFLSPQAVHYNFVEGHLLIDGKPLGRLPGNIRESEEVRELFGNQHLLTYPSSLDCMSHVMATRIHGHEIHFGLRGKTIIIRALIGRKLLEYVPRSVFMDSNNFDIPLRLIEDCVHWLNFHSKCLEIRRKPAIWRSRLSDWTLDILKRQAWRKQVFLVDPLSDLCKRVAGIFRYFEDAQRLTVFQPVKGNLSVELRHLELNFYVNRRSLLQCRELHAEIDPNQDAGTLYGLQSTIVLRDIANIDRRSIIVALGKLLYKRHGMHVTARACSSSLYGRFEIDSVLGRLSCPPEPLLLYSKALFHAFTSFVVPDPLTGRTGSEEALHTLRSGYCQPWTPMSEHAASILKVIQKLSPCREYYPRDKRRLQTVIWDQNVTTYIQQDSYEALVQELLEKSERLRAFVTHDTEATKNTIEDSSHLRKRGEICRLLYERNHDDSDKPMNGKDVIYRPRDREVNLAQAANVYKIVQLIRRKSFSVHMKRGLPDILHGWKLIGGFHSSTESTPVCLNDLIENSISGQWGGLVNYCRHTDPQDQYRLIFRLSLLSFGKSPDMDAMQSLVAFGCLHELKALQPPDYPSFTEFRMHESPTLESLLRLIVSDYPIFKPDPRQKKKQQIAARKEHEALCEAEGRGLARSILEQWPNSELSATKRELTIIDAEVTLNRISPEFQRLNRNMDLSKYLVQVQEILDRYRGVENKLVPRAWNTKSPGYYIPNSSFIIPSLSKDLLVTCGPIPGLSSSLDPKIYPSKDVPRRTNFLGNSNNVSPKTPPSRQIIELNAILASFIASSDILRHQYGVDLKNSLDALENVCSQAEVDSIIPSSGTVRDRIEKARMALEDQFENIRHAFIMDDRFQWLQLGNLWPCITPMTLLEQLSSRLEHEFSGNVREGLVLYGVLTTTLQRLLRIKDAQLNGNRHKILEECRNLGHENWSPLDFPDWLLIEIDSDLLIRREQTEVAHAITLPASQSNSVLQMNMGKGKFISLKTSNVICQSFTPILLLSSSS